MGAKYKGAKNWVEKDLKFEFRQLIGLLLGIRKNFIERNLEKAALWIEKDAFSLFYYDEEIITLAIDEDKKIIQKINPEWVEYLSEGNYEELRSTCNVRIAKGGGKGKKKSKSE